MKFLPMNGMQMPALGFGTWQLEGNTCIQATLVALEMGYRHIDTAQAYENENEVGKAVANSCIDRKELFITTKLWTNNFTHDRVHASLEESLNKLKMDYVNLLLIHWPNPQVPLQETLSAMQELQTKGKVKAIGVSNFPVNWMQDAVEKYKAPVACNQVEYHALLSQRAVLDYATKHNIVVTAYSPLARGKVTSNQVLVDIGKKHGKAASQVALRWLVEQDGVAVIPKAATAKNAKLNWEIFDFELDSDDRKAIDALSGNTRIVNPAGLAPKWDAA